MSGKSYCIKLCWRWFNINISHSSQGCSILDRGIQWTLRNVVLAWQSWSPKHGFEKNVAENLNIMQQLWLWDSCTKLFLLLSFPLFSLETNNISPAGIVRIMESLLKTHSVEEIRLANQVLCVFLPVWFLLTCVIYRIKSKSCVL